MKEKEKNIIVEKSYAFSVRCVKLYKYLVEVKRNETIGKQLLRSGTSIGANVKEGIRGYSQADFAAKLSIAHKEASETEYWIELLRDTDYITGEQAKSMLSDCIEVIKLLTAIVKTAQENLNKGKKL